MFKILGLVSFIGVQSILAGVVSDVAWRTSVVRAEAREAINSMLSEVR